MFDKYVLRLDPKAEVDRIAESLREQVLGQLRKRGAVVGISGGIDNLRRHILKAVCAMTHKLQLSISANQLVMEPPHIICCNQNTP